MLLEIVLISISLAVVTALFVHKHVESAAGAHPKIVTVREKADTHVKQAIIHAEKAASSITFRNIVIVLNGIVVWVARMFLFLSSATHRAFHRLVEHGSRRQENLKRRGAASFYLKQITEKKDDSDKTHLTS